MNENNDKIFNRLFERYPELETLKTEILTAGEILKNAGLAGNKILVCGNGGSAADADHIAGELLKSFCRKRPLEKKLSENLKKSIPTREKNLPQNFRTEFRRFP